MMQNLVRTVFVLTLVTNVRSCFSHFWAWCTVHRTNCSNTQTQNVPRLTHKEVYFLFPKQDWMH